MWIEDFFTLSESDFHLKQTFIFSIFFDAMFIGPVLFICMLKFLSPSLEHKYMLKVDNKDTGKCVILSKLCPLFFIKFLFFHQMVGLQKLWKMCFISSKKLFSFLRYSNFCIFLPSFPHFPDSKDQMEVE